MRCSFLPDAEHRRGAGQGPRHRRARPAPRRRGARDRTGRTSSRCKERWRCRPAIRGTANPKSSTGPARRLHPGDHRRAAPLRRDRRRLHGRAVPRGGAALASPCGCARACRSTSCGCRSARRALTDDERAAAPREDAAAVPGRRARRPPTSFGTRRRPLPRPRPRAATSDGRVGYRARAQRRRCSTWPQVGAAPASSDYWEPVRSEDGDRVVLDPEHFYLLLSDEAVRHPARRSPRR